MSAPTTTLSRFGGGKQTAYAFPPSRFCNYSKNVPLKKIWTVDYLLDWIKFARMLGLPLPSREQVIETTYQHLNKIHLQRTGQPLLSYYEVEAIVNEELFVGWQL